MAAAMQTPQIFLTLSSTKILPFLLDLNLQVAAKEANGEKVTPPGLPAWVKGSFITDDCVGMEE